MFDDGAPPPDGAFATQARPPDSVQTPDHGLAEAFRLAMRQVASGVAVVTAHADGQDHGMTANAFASVSLDPPSVLVVVNRVASLHGPIVAGGGFRLNILAHDQVAVAERFATRPGGEARFGTGAWRRDGRSPARLLGAQASVLCALDQAVPSGSHTIFIGRVIEAAAETAGDPLVHLRGGYRGLAAEPQP